MASGGDSVDPPVTVDDGTRIGPQEARNGPEKGGLPGAVCPEDRHHLTGCDLQGDAAQCFEGAVADPDTVHFKKHDGPPGTPL